MSTPYKLQATYKDGYVYEQNAEDTSLFDPKRNCFYDIYNKLVEPDHGPLVKLAVIRDTSKHETDYSELDPSARPVFYREMEADFTVVGGIGEARITKQFFGYQYNKDGKSIKVIKEVT